MEKITEVTAQVLEREVIFTRTIDAPREAIYRAFTEREHVGHWWGPWGFTITTHEMDVRPGGVWRFDMHGPDGTNYPNRITYMEVSPPEWLRFKHGGDDDKLDEHFEVTVTFSACDGKTELTMRSVFDSAETLRQLIETVDAIEGGKQTLTRLADYVAKME